FALPIRFLSRVLTGIHWLGSPKRARRLNGAGDRSRVRHINRQLPSIPFRSSPPTNILLDSLGEPIYTPSRSSGVLRRDEDRGQTKWAINWSSCRARWTC